jgi:hypothetical protein
MKVRSRFLILITTAIFGLGLGACAAEEEATVSVVVQGATFEGNVVSIVLWAHTDGTQYEFVVTGDAGTTEATFVLEVFLDSALVHTIPFSLPLEDVDAEPGESGSGSQVAVIYPGSTVNNVVIEFAWTGNPVPIGDTNIDLQFIHPPRIIVWSASPGPGVPAGTDIDIRAEVEFFSLNRSVEVQFLDGLGEGTPIGTPVDLTFSDPLWVGTITAQGGAEQLRLTATDDDGSTASRASFVVDP